MPFAYIAQEIWRWIAETGINLALLVLLALLIPRAGRFANRMAEKQVHESGDTDEGKTRLAIAGVGINIAQIVAFFLLLVFFLQQIGFSLVGATLPATVVSAAIGFGAQSIIADFLAGFFILTEKQYGVGDFVTFEGNGVEVSGDVIQITMRSTHIRTIEQSTVSIPNSTARICINHSNYWSSALVVIPVPLLGSTSADEATARAERAARRALSDPEITKVVLGDLSVHPAVAVTPPVVVGMPWTMDVRFLVRVEPLSQWMVERAIRIAVLNEFWEEYGSAPTMAGTRLDHVVDHTLTSDAYPPTEFMKPVHPGSGDYDETRLNMAATPKASNDEEDHIRPDADEDPAADALDDGTSGTTEPRRAFGGVMRLSTGVLLAMFAVLLLARGLTLGATDANPDQSGVLAPPPRTTATSPTATEPAPVPTTQRTTPATGSPTTAPSTTESAPARTGEETPEATQPAVPAETTAPGGTGRTPAPVAPTTPGGAGASTGAGAPATATQAPQ